MWSRLTTIVPTAAVMGGAVLVLDPGVGQGHHRLAAADGDQGSAIRAARGGSRGPDTARAAIASGCCRVRRRRPASPADRRWTNRISSRLTRTSFASRAPALETLDHHVHELVLVVLVEQIGDAIGGQSDATRQDAVLGVGDEVDPRVAQRAESSVTTGSAGSDPGRWKAKSSRRPASWIMLPMVGRRAARASTRRSRSAARVATAHRCARASPARA